MLDRREVSRRIAEVLERHESLVALEEIMVVIDEIVVVKPVASESRDDLHRELAHAQGETEAALERLGMLLNRFHGTPWTHGSYTPQ